MSRGQRDTSGAEPAAGDTSLSFLPFSFLVAMQLLHRFEGCGWPEAILSELQHQLLLQALVEHHRQQLLHRTMHHPPSAAFGGHSFGVLTAQLGSTSGTSPSTGPCRPEGITGLAYSSQQRSLERAFSRAANSSWAASSGIHSSE